MRSTLFIGAMLLGALLAVTGRWVYDTYFTAEAWTPVLAMRLSDDWVLEVERQPINEEVLEYAFRTYLVETGTQAALRRLGPIGLEPGDAQRRCVAIISWRDGTEKLTHLGLVRAEVQQQDGLFGAAERRDVEASINILDLEEEVILQSLPNGTPRMEGTLNTYLQPLAVSAPGRAKGDCATLELNLSGWTGVAVVDR